MRKSVAFILAFLTIFGTNSMANAALQQNKSDAFQKSSTAYFETFAPNQTYGTPTTNIVYDTPFSYALQYPQTQQPIANKRITQTISKIKTDFEKKYTTLAKQIANKKTVHKETATLLVGYESHVNTDGIATVAFQQTEQVVNQIASPTTWHTISFDTANGNNITAADIFRNNYREKASAYAIKYFEQNKTYAPALFGDYRTALAANSDIYNRFALKKDSVIFYINKYEILPAEFGAIRLEIPKSELYGTFLTDPIVIPAQKLTPAKVVKKAELIQDIATKNKPETSTRVIDPKKPMVALTFDDGPSPKATNAILDTLEQYGVVATFFDVGYRVEQYPDVVKREATLGNEVASHSYDHKNFAKLTPQQIQEDVKKVNAAFQKAGVSPTLFRPPYGSTNSTVSKNMPLPIVTWSVDTLDWKTRNTQSILQEIEKEGNLDGKVILMHGIYDTTADAVAKLVPELLEQGYQIVTVSELLQYRHQETPVAGKLYGFSYFQ